MSRDEATLRQVESQPGIVGRELRDLEQATDADAERAAADAPPSAAKTAPGAPVTGRTRMGVFPQALDARLRFDYERLLRDRKVSEATPLCGAGAARVGARRRARPAERSG